MQTLQIRNQVCKDFLHTAEDGNNYKTKYYNLNAIIAVGFNEGDHL